MLAILFEVLLIETQEEIHHFAGWEGGQWGTKIVNKNFVNKLASPIGTKIDLKNVSRNYRFPRSCCDFMAG